MMVNPTKRQKELIKIFEEEVAPWCYVDKKTGDIKLKEDAPQKRTVVPLL